MKILVTGSRKWRNVETIKADLIAYKVSLLIHGAAPGADLIAEGIAKQQEVPYHGYPARWTQYGKAAGPLRNTFMLHEEHLSPGVDPIELVLAYPMKESVGTFHMIELCEHAGLRVVVDRRYLI